MDNFIKCPHCNSNHVKTSIKGKMTNAMSYGIGAAANALISSFLPFDTHSTGVIAKGVKSFVPIEYECKRCDCLFSVQFNENQEIQSIEVKQLPVPDEIIKKEKEEYIAKMESEISYTWAIIYALISVGLFIYCWNADFKYQVWREATWFQDAGYYNDWHYSWLLYALLCVVFSISTLVSLNNTSNKKEKIRQASQSTLMDFKHSHSEIFAKYPQYR